MRCSDMSDVLCIVSNIYRNGQMQRPSLSVQWCELILWWPASVPRWAVVGTEAQGRALSLVYSCTLMYQPPHCTSAHSGPPGVAPPAGQEPCTRCFAEKQGLYKWPILKV